MMADILSVLQRTIISVRSFLFCCFEIENTLCLIEMYQCSMWSCKDETIIMGHLWKEIMQNFVCSSFLSVIVLVERPWCNTPEDSDVKRNIWCDSFKDVFVWFMQFVICTKCTNFCWSKWIILNTSVSCTSFKDFPQSPTQIFLHPCVCLPTFRVSLSANFMFEALIFCWMLHYRSAEHFRECPVECKAVCYSRNV